MNKQERKKKGYFGYLRVGTYPIDKVLNKYGDHEENFNGFMVSMGSKRYRTFLNTLKERGELVCEGCGMKATHFALETFHTNKVIKVLEAKRPLTEIKFHFNLYGYDKNGKEVLFTKDHIFPKSKGGDDSPENLRTMCAPCNFKKSDTVLTERAG